jgi:hypothetical protein
VPPPGPCRTTCVGASWSWAPAGGGDGDRSRSRRHGCVSSSGPDSPAMLSETVVVVVPRRHHAPVSARPTGEGTLPSTEIHLQRVRGAPVRPLARSSSALPPVEHRLVRRDLPAVRARSCCSPTTSASAKNEHHSQCRPGVAKRRRRPPLAPTPGPAGGRICPMRPSVRSARASAAGRPGPEKLVRLGKGMNAEALLSVVLHADGGVCPRWLSVGSRVCVPPPERCLRKGGAGGGAVRRFRDGSNR